MPADATPPVTPNRTSSVDEVLAILRTQGPCSQAELVRLTGLSKGTINNVVKRLLSENIVSLQQKNRKEAWVILGVGLDAIASVEVSTQQIRVTLFDFTRHLRIEEVTETSAETNTPETVLHLLQLITEQAGIAIADLPCVSVAIQSAIDRASGALVAWSGGRLPGWKDINLVERLEALLGVSVLVENDANLAAYGEWTWGRGRGCDDFFYLLCSQGVGGGMIINGKIYRGGTGVAGEVGHMALDHTGPVCFCGSRGCLHALVSERALLAALSTSESPQDSLAGVIHAAHSGDAACQRVLFEAGLNLGRAVANTARVMAPSTIVIGGLLSDAEDLLLDSIHSSPEMQHLLTLASNTQLHLAELKDAVTLGSVAAALAHLGRGMVALPEWMLVDTINAESNHPASTQLLTA